MAGDGSDIRIAHLEEDSKETRADVKDMSKSIAAIVISLTKSEGLQEKMLAMLIDNKCTLDADSKRSIENERLTLNLKIVTDKQTTDILEVKKEVKDMREKPFKDYDKFKWALILYFLSYFVGTIGSTIDKFLGK